MYKKVKADQLVFKLAMRVFEFSKKFLKEQRCVLIHETRRSYHSVCVHIGGADRKRAEKKYFTVKLSHVGIENKEIQVWIDFIFVCQNVIFNIKEHVYKRSIEIGKLSGCMIQNSETFNTK